jgi:quercetin dioxygenase-like cupin family protein
MTSTTASSHPGPHEQTAPPDRSGQPAEPAHSGPAAPPDHAGQLVGAGQPTVWWQGARMTIRAHGDGTGGALGLVEARFPAGFGPPLHVHHREDEALYVLEGRLRCRAGDRELTAGPGQLVFGPREVPHAFQAGPEGARALVLMLPAGLEQMFLDGGVPATDPDVPPVEDYDLEQVAVLAARYGFDIVGPPLG